MVIPKLYDYQKTSKKKIVKTHFTVLIFFALATTLTHAASFDCNMVSNTIEQAICKDPLLSKLDDTLSENYKYIFASKISVRVRKDLKATQRSWLTTRNKCTDNECLVNAYKEQIDGICDYPIPSDAAPICKSADEAETEVGKPHAQQAHHRSSNITEDADVIKVIVQICVPNKVVAFEDIEVDLTQIPKDKTFVEMRDTSGIRSHQTENQRTSKTNSNQGDKDVVRRWIVGFTPGELEKYWIPFSDISNTDGVLRAGGEFISLFTSTQKNQPVFEVKGRRQKDYIALKTSVEVKKDGQHEYFKYWFKLPPNIPTGEFSNWQEPISQEDRQIRDKQQNPTFWNLLHGREIDVYPVGENAPKMRFKLMRVRDYYEENKPWYRSQKAITEKYYKGATGDERERIHFIPKSSSIIPAC